jgi:hypothetical protein
MKATHNKASEGKVEWKFPCLGIGRLGELVGFTSLSEGTIVSNPQGGRKMLEHRDDWIIDNFTPLPSTESVTLQND